jgi:Cu2+-exporting ATPase
MFVDRLRCAGCVWLIERTLSTLPGVISVQVNPSAGRARVVWQSDLVSLAEIVQRLAQTGYHGLPLDAAALDDARRRERRDGLKRLGVAGIGMMQAMMYAASLYVGAAQQMDPATRDFLRWLGLLVSTPVVFYAARPFFVGAWRSVRERHSSIDVPVALAITLSYVASVVETLRRGPEVYFDSVSMFVFFLLVGRYLEMRARHNAGDLVDATARMTPSVAERMLPDGTTECVSAVELQAGDLVHVSEGGLIPADGRQESLICRVDEKLLTGESTPRVRRRGDALLAGSVLIDGPTQVRVERTGDTTVLAGIVALTARAQSERPRLARAGERIAERFVVSVLLLASLTAVGWLLVDPTRAFDASVAVLVASCPCAFALAAPAVITRAMAVLARAGVLVVRPDAVSTLASATHAVFDKTGTLTGVSLSSEGVQVFGATTRAEALALAGALARQSRHPVARAIASISDVTLPAEQVEAVVGNGLRGRVQGRWLRFGRAAFAAPGQPADTADDNLLWLSDESGMLASFRLRERLQPGASEAVRTLQAAGLQAEIVSGDAPENVRATAVQLGITTWHARQTPEDKFARLRELRAQGAQVMAVGDGVNDAPVLAGADVAIGLGSGADLARLSSDVVLMGDSLDRLSWARTVAQRASVLLRQNQRWSLCYNLALMPAAAFGLVPPWLAALGMSCSSLIVVLNALRIKDNTAPFVPSVGRIATSTGAP